MYDERILIYSEIKVDCEREKKQESFCVCRSETKSQDCSVIFIRIIKRSKGVWRRRHSPRIGVNHVI